MFIAITKTAYGTKRVYIRARDTELEGTDNFDNLQTIKNVMNLACCWGGTDKQERDFDDAGGYISWELPLETADVIYSALSVLLTRAHFDVVDDLMKATERWVEEA